ncbi:hypothetical protein LCGC14_2045980, partial [marine sediment metagenome]
RKLLAFKDNLYGFLKARKAGLPFLINEEEGKFVRKLRWKNIKQKLL